MLTIRLTTVSGRRLPHASRRICTRAFWRGALPCMFLLAGVLLALHFSLHTYGDFDDGSHQCPASHIPASHINVAHSGLRDAQVSVDRADRVAPDVACAAAVTLASAAPRYFDEAPVRAPISAAYTSILSARGPPARQ